MIEAAADEMIVVAEAAVGNLMAEAGAEEVDSITVAEVAVIEEILIVNHKKGTRQYVQRVRKNVKCRSSRLKEETFFVKTVLLIGTKLDSLGNFFYFLGLEIGLRKLKK